MRVFTGNSINDVYMDILRTVMNEGTRKSPRGKPTQEIRPVVIHLTNSSSAKFLMIPGRHLNYAFALAEVVWILAGRGDAEFIGFYNKRMLDYLDKPDDPEFHGAYGKRIRKYDSHGYNIDQIKHVIKKLTFDRDTRQAVISLWDPVKDNLKTRSKDYPCNVLVMFKLTGTALDISVVRRSNDVIWGLPYNIIQFTSLQEYVAGHLGMGVGQYYEYVDSMHIYEKEYPDLYEFFLKGSTHTLEYQQTLVPMSAILPGKYMDVVLGFIQGIDQDWRETIAPGTANMPMYVNDWIVEIDAMSCGNRYWRNVSYLLLAYHLYKSRFDEMVKQVSRRLETPFDFMAKETFKRMGGQI